MDEDRLPRQLFDCSTCLATLNWCLGERSKQRWRNVPWTGRPGGTLSKTLLQWDLRSPNRIGHE
eukprot:60477-Chlamydomonas_euryale.AAC.4